MKWCLNTQCGTCAILLSLVRAMAPAVAPLLSPRRPQVSSVRLVAEHVGKGLVSVCLSVCLSVRVFLYFPVRIIYQCFILSIHSFISDAMYCWQFAVPLNKPDSEETLCNTLFCPDDGGSSVLRSIAPYVSLFCLPP